jgi:hypothetical protein
MATTVKLPTGTLVPDLKFPGKWKAMYVSPAGLRVGKIGTSGSFMATDDDVTYLFATLSKSDRRFLRKFMHRHGARRQAGLRPVCVVQHTN